MGDAYTLGGGDGTAAPFRESRGVQRHRGRITHQGSDLINGRSGDTVRAVAHGLVIVATSRNGNGYGDHVVLAHRDRLGALHYSVYAHLLAGSTRVREGMVVAAGQALGRVGRTGQATAAHLHFEVRECVDPGQPWELAPVVEPLPFIAERLPAAPDDGGWARRYLEWGESAALVRAGGQGEDALSRAQWWRMLAHSAISPIHFAAFEPAALRDSLIALGVLPVDDAAGSGDHAASWQEIARDIRRLRDVGVRLPPAPAPEDSLRLSCANRLGSERPSRRPRDLTRLEDPPTLALVCLVLADVAAESWAGQVEESAARSDAEPAPRRRSGRKRGR